VDEGPPTRSRSTDIDFGVDYSYEPSGEDIDRAIGQGAREALPAAVAKSLSPHRKGRTLNRMISWLAALAAVVLAAATTLTSSAQGVPGAVRIEVLSVKPSPPRAAAPFELVARVEFAPAPGSIRCSVWTGGRRYRDIRLVWENSIARCFFRVPAGARGKRLTVALTASLGSSTTRTTLAFRVS